MVEPGRACGARRHYAAMVGSALLVVALLPIGDVAAAGSGASHTVIIESTSFEPTTITLKRGDTVVWINRDPFPHTATSKTGGFDSGEIAPGKSWSHRFLKPGNVDYVCSLHPTMKGSVRVVE